MQQENILGTIGGTPLVKLNRVTKEIDALICKGGDIQSRNSTKDRMALKMIDDAEADGRLQPGGTIIEGTSGNTGMGLALVAIIRGYKLICVISDKQSKEKMDILRAVVVVVVPLMLNLLTQDHIILFLKD
jgi:cystathionine beta-synthase